MSATESEHDSATEAIPAVVPDDATTAIPKAAPAQDADDELLEPGWEQPRRMSKVTLGLVAGLLAALAFIGGVLVQKNHDAGLVAGAGRARIAEAGGQQRAGGGSGQGGGQQVGGGQQGGSGQQGGAAAPADSGTPAVVGTVTTVAGDTLTVTNLGGTAVKVTVPATATVTTTGLAGLTAGAPVSVVGTKNPDGSVTATAVTSRKSNG